MLAQRRGEFDDVAVVVFEEAQADRLEVEGLAEDFDVAGAELGERCVDVGYVDETWWILNAEAVVERVDRVMGSAAQPPRISILAEPLLR